MHRKLALLLLLWLGPLAMLAIGALALARLTRRKA